MTKPGMTKILVIAVLAGVMLAGCGRRGAPSPPGPASDVSYPHTYPAE
jgi:predicted small lipoprotein YifL